MNIWLVKSHEPIWEYDKEESLGRMGKLTKALVGANHDVSLFTSSFDHTKKKYKVDKTCSINIKDNYQVNFIHSNSYQKNISLQRLMSSYKESRNFKKIISDRIPPDVIFCAYPTIDLAYEAVKYAKKNNVKVIIDIRDFWPDIFVDRLHGIKKALIYPYYLFSNRRAKNIFNEITYLTGVTGKAVEWGAYKRSSKTSEPITQPFYIGCETKDALEINTYRRNCNHPEKYLTFIGSLGNSFNYPLIKKIAIELKGLMTIRIAGDGPQFNTVKDMMKDVENVEFMGWCNNQQMSQLLIESFAVLAPYNDSFDFNMGVGNKFCQGTSYSLPMIVTCKGVMNELIHNYDCGLCSDNEQDIKAYLENLLNDRSEYIRVCNNSFEIYQELFDADNIYKDIVSFIEKTEEETK